MGQSLLKNNLYTRQDFQHKYIHWNMVTIVTASGWWNFYENRRQDEEGIILFLFNAKSLHQTILNECLKFNFVQMCLPCSAHSVISSYLTWVELHQHGSCKVGQLVRCCLWEQPMKWLQAASATLFKTWGLNLNLLKWNERWNLLREISQEVGG